MAHYIYIVATFAQCVSLVASVSTRHLAPPETETVGRVHSSVDHAVVAKCSLREHAKAELAVSRSGLDLSVNESSCANSMDSGPAETMYVSLLGGLPPGESRRTIWVSGYPRSGTSTVLSMISVGQTVMDDYHGDETIFSLFEPCHDGDEFVGAGCGDLLWQLSRCNFTGIGSLWGWTDSHSTSKQTDKEPYSPEGATSLCNAANVVAFKTVSAEHRLKYWEWLLDETSDLHILDVIRDPRGIYASRKTTEPFATRIARGSFDTKGMIRTICDVFSENIDFGNKRVHRVVFEQLLANPEKTMREAYTFMGMKFGKRQKTWIKETFDVSECSDDKLKEFSDCHTNSSEVAEKWRSVLSQKELDLFAQIEPCQRVLQYYGFGLM